MTLGEPATRRILYVTDGFAPQRVGGMQSFARRQLETIAAAGYDLTSVTPGGAAEPAEALPWRNIALPWPKRSRFDRINPWRYVNDLKRFSVSVCETIDRESPDLVYSEGPLLHHWLRRPGRRTPAIFHPHGLEMFQHKGAFAEDLKSLPLRTIVADHARRADYTACLSETGALPHILAGIGVPKGRIETLPNAAPLTPTEPRTSPSGQRRLLFVGRPEPRKALPLLLHAFAAVDGATLDIVGAETLSVPVPGGVTLHGLVRDPARIAQFYADADFLVIPSHAEGMPTVILEAFAAALPVIATDVGASGDMVRNGETGFLVPRGDRHALSAAMRAALTMPAIDYARLSANCLAMARGRFSAQAAQRALLALLDRALAVDKKR